MVIDTTETLGLTKTEKSENEEKQPEILRYGFKRFRPDCLQIFNKPIFFLIIACFVVFGHGFSATGLNNTALTSIEKRYGLKTTQISMFLFCQHISSGLLCLITCYFGHRHRPVMIAIGCCLVSVGFLIISVPQYIVPAYKAGIVLATDTCRLNATTTSTSHCKSAKVDGDVNVFPIFLLGYALLGIGVSPLYSLTYAHIDEITSRKKSYIYYTVISIVGILGPSAGFMAANPILRIFVDIKQPADSNLKLIDRNWVGAWWLAFVIGSVAMFIPVIPLIGFPSKFSDTERKIKEKRKFQDTAQNDQKLTNDFKSIVPALISLLKNKPFLFLSISIALELLVISGFATFLPKHLESQFHLTASKAASASGFIMLPGSIIGISLGAFICRKFSLNGRQLLIYNAVVLLLNTIALTGILLGCEGRDIVGVTSSYLNSTHAGNETVLLGLQNPCNEPCHCNTRFYKPVCSVHEQKTYYSPCHAGCSAGSFQNNQYTNCTCLESLSSKVMKGRCSPPCRSYPIFMVLFFIATCISFMTKVPIVQATFRLVPEGQGSLAQGLQQMLARFIGFIPAAPLFGSLIDKSCKLWHTDVCSGKTTSCLEYDNEKFRFYLWVLCVVVKLVGLLFMLVALKCYRLPEKQKVEDLLKEEELRMINLKA